jgi:hypothetical protein
MEFGALSFACPVCGSREVTYTCDPGCCFNHVCNVCYATFEPFTIRLNREAAIDRPAAPPDSCEPTVECAACGSLAVYSVSSGAPPDGAYACAACRALLALDFENIVPQQA